MKRFLFKFFFVLFALIVALPAQAVTVFVKGSTSPYVKVGDSYQQLTSSVTTSDNVTWYYADVADNSTISFATDNNGSKASPSFTVTTGSAYFYYDGNSNAVNMTDMKDKASYCLLEVNSSYWAKDGAIFKIWDSKNDMIDMKAIGGNGSNKYVYLYAQNDYTVANNANICFKRFNPKGDSQWNYFNTTYTKGAYYVTTGWDDTGEKTTVAEYKNIVWPEKPTPTNYTYALHGQITGNQNWESTAMTDEGNGIWSLTRDFVKGEFGIRKMDADGNQVGWLGSPYIGSPADNCVQSGSNIKLTADGNYTISFNTKTEKITVTKNSASIDEIPVYPAGVNSKAELNAYDFEANPVYYLLADVLNANRVTPEWQLTKGADNKYHLNGFAMRYTGAVKVRQYTSAGTYVDYDSKEFDTELKTSEGQLYNATFDPTEKKFTLTPASGTKMPFISLVGYMMQQDQVYDTPRGVEKTPEGTKTSKGWQEAWLLYDANGKLLKDRKGNVMYSTMWPPKNPVYFTATISENNQRLYSSDQMTFVPVKDADGNNVGKTGAEWKAELKKLDEEAYKGLTIDDNKTYYRYVVSDIWYVGAGKIWTGWGGETTYDNNKQIANWSKHKNWGYEDKNATDTEGTAIDAQKTYNVKQSAGNFLFENPTYFKTFEFFYETGDPNANSQIYTTLAYGSASIAAKNVKEGDSYTKGSYQATVTVPEDMTVSSWTITRHDATNDALAPIGSDNGVVATGDGTNFPTGFKNDKGGLGEGRYYYELTVTFSNKTTSTERTSTVRSNPFVIYFPNQYSVDANGYQLVKLDTAIDGYDYVTYNAKANGDLYFVNLTTDNKVANFRVATSAEREKVNFAANSGIKWTDKVFVYAPVPAEFKVDAEKKNATVSLDQIVSYDVNATKGVSPVNHELAVVDNKGNFANKVYKAVMNYKEKDIASTETEKWSDKTSLGKENLTVMQMPNVKGGEVKVTVTAVTDNSAELSIDYNGTTKKATPAAYYNVSVELPFSDPNVEAAVAPQYEVKVTDANDVTTTKVYTASGTGERAITFTNVNPLDFKGKSIEVNAKYFDGEGYNLYANLGESAKLASGTAKFTGCTPDFHTLKAIASKAPVLDGNGNMIKDDQGYHKQKDVIVVTNLGVSHSGTNDNIGGKTVDAGNALYNADFYLQDAVAHNGVYILDELNFTAEFKPANDENKHNVWTGGAIIFDNNTGVTEKPNLKVEITPFYVAKVTNTEGTVGLNAQDVASAPADETYVALTCETADKQGLQLETSIVDITESANVKAYKVIENGEIYIIYGDRKFNVMGAEVK
ncbi:MAG: hypothetical protein PUE25_02995 [bacterium]|nr:hypothetical protein [bacterium]